MSFWPLVTSLVDRLRDAQRGAPLVDLGCGEGSFSRRLNSLGLQPLLLDRQPDLRALDLRGDALDLPFRDASLGGAVAANLLRQLGPRERQRFARECARAVRPRGVLLVLEDSPQANDEAEANYRRALALLSEVDPERGPAVAMGELEENLRTHWPYRLEAGSQLNEETVQDPMSPMRWLLAQPRCDESLRRRTRELCERVSQWGMSYGRYEYALFASKP